MVVSILPFTFQSSYGVNPERPWWLAAEMVVSASGSMISKSASAPGWMTPETVLDAISELEIDGYLLATGEPNSPEYGFKIKEKEDANGHHNG